MIVHVVLFRPRADLTDAERGLFLDALVVARRRIPSIRRFHIGRRITHGPAYERRMTEDYPYAAVIEFDDLQGLQEYLQHPEHGDLGNRFNESLAAALVYDYDMRDQTAL